MKALLCFTLFFINNYALAQTTQSLTLNAYLKQEGYLKLTDTTHLLKSIMSCYPIIMDSLSKRPDLKNYYVLSSTIKNNKSLLCFLIYPISGIIAVKENAEKAAKNRKADSLHKDTIIKVNGVDVQMKIQRIDSFGGSVGELLVKLNKSTNKIELLGFQ